MFPVILVERLESSKRTVLTPIVNEDDLVLLAEGAEDSVEALGAVLGRTPAELESGFRAWVETRAASRRDDVLFIHAQSEAKDRYVAADYPGLIAALTRALEFKPGDVQTLFNLASARMRTGDYDGVVKDLERLLDLEQDPRSRFVVFAHYQLGRVYDIQGRRDEALRHYRAMLELPDQGDAHRLALEAIETPFTTDQLE